MSPLFSPQALDKGSKHNGTILEVHHLSIFPSFNFSPAVTFRPGKGNETKGGHSTISPLSRFRDSPRDQQQPCRQAKVHALFGASHSPSASRPCLTPWISISGCLRRSRHSIGTQRTLVLASVLLPTSSSSWLVQILGTRVRWMMCSTMGRDRGGGLFW
jgi:hypothetical protein